MGTHHIPLVRFHPDSHAAGPAAERTIRMSRRSLHPAYLIPLLLAAALPGSPVREAAAQPREGLWHHPVRSDRGPATLPANVERLDSLAGITEYRLKSNGMSILLAPNHR